MTHMTPEEARTVLEALAEDVLPPPGTPAFAVKFTFARALETIAGLQEEWGVEIEGKIPGTWYQLNFNGIAPDHYADAAWLETRKEAESLQEDVLEGGRYEKARLVRRYVSAHQVIDDDE